MRKRIGTFMVIAALALSFAACDSSDYKKAMTLYNDGKYAEAAEQFKALGTYEDSEKKEKECEYKSADSLLKSGEYKSAKDIFSALADYKDCKDKVKECDYMAAEDLYNSGDYDGAISLYESISGFSDADTKVDSIKQEQMREKYKDVIAALSKETWYFNGGSDTVLNSISFTDSEATIAQVYYDGNGIHDNGSNSGDYVIEDDKISVTVADGSTIEIDYSIEGDKISLGKGEYLTTTEVDAGIQGYWILEDDTFGKHINEIHLDNGNVTSESAAAAYDEDGYFYYGPDNGTYTINFGGLNTDMRHGGEWFWNIINGSPTMLHYGGVCSKTDKLMGEEGFDKYFGI